MSTRELGAGDRGLVLLTSAVNEAFGAGCVVLRSRRACYVLTSRHVVTNLGGAHALRWGDRRIASVSALDGALDLALLRAESPGPVEAMAVAPADGVDAGDELRILGFSRVSSQEYLARELPVSVRGRSWMELHALPERVLAFELEMMGLGRLEPGHSGSPLATASGGVVGVLAWRQEEGRRGVAIATDGLRALRLTDPQARISVEVGPSRGLAEAIAELEYREAVEAVYAECFRNLDYLPQPESALEAALRAYWAIHRLNRDTGRWGRHRDWDDELAYLLAGRLLNERPGRFAHREAGSLARELGRYHGSAVEAIHRECFGGVGPTDPEDAVLARATEAYRRISALNHRTGCWSAEEGIDHTAIFWLAGWMLEHLPSEATAGHDQASLAGRIGEGLHARETEQIYRRHLTALDSGPRADELVLWRAWNLYQDLFRLNLQTGRWQDRAGVDHTLVYFVAERVAQHLKRDESYRKKLAAGIARQATGSSPSHPGAQRGA